MKKSLLIIGMALCLAAAGCAADGYIDAQPADVTYDQGVAPYPGYVWIDGDWMWGGGGYHWHQGRWAAPRAGHVYQRGSWNHTSRGYHWNRGHWR